MSTHKSMSKAQDVLAYLQENEEKRFTNGDLCRVFKVNSSSMRYVLGMLSSRIQKEVNEKGRDVYFARDEELHQRIRTQHRTVNFKPLNLQKFYSLQLERLDRIGDFTPITCKGSQHVT